MHGQKEPEGARGEGGGEEAEMEAERKEKEGNDKTQALVETRRLLCHFQVKSS